MMAETPPLPSRDTFDNLPSRDFAIEIAEAPWWDDLPHGAQEIVRRYAGGRLVDREALDPLIDSIRTWSKAYPIDVFPPPPKGKHAATIDGCHAHAGRHIIGRLMELIPDG